MVIPTARGKAILTRPPLVAPPPGGGADFDFTPADYQVLLRPSGLSQSAGVVTGWSNDGALGGTFNVTGSPTYLADAINGLHGAQFTYANGLLSSTAFTLGGGSGKQSFIALVAFDAYLDSPIIFNHGLTANDGLTLDISSSGSGTPQRIEALGDGYSGGSPPPAVMSANNVISGTNFYVIRVDLGPTNMIELNGLTLTPATNVGGATPSFSANLAVAGQSYLRLVYGVAALDKSDALLDKVVGKIAWDAGLTLDASHPYALARPTA